MRSSILARVGLDGLGGRRLLTLGERGIGDFFRDGCPQLAAAIAYHALLSVFPLVIVLVWVSTWFLDDGQARQEIIDLVTDQIALSPSGEEQLSEQLKRATDAAGTAGIIGLALLVWAASAMMTSIRFGINTAWNSTQRRFFLRGKLLDLAVVGLLGVLAVGSLLLSVTLRLLPDVAALGSGPISLLVPIAVSFTGFLVAYRVLPAVKTYTHEIWPAALGAALVLEVLKGAFAFYLSSISDNDVVYGSVGAVISFILFVYLASNLLLLGAEFASELPRVRAGLYDGDPSDDGPSLGERIWSELRRATESKPEEDFRLASKPGDDP